MKLYLFTIIFLIISVSVFGQKERKFIRQGNVYYDQAVENSDSVRIDSVNFAKAEVEYRKALQKKPNDFKSQFNIGDALFKQNKMEESSVEYEQILDATSNKEDKGKAWFNYGNSMLVQNKLDESIDAYKNALRNNPKDLEAKYNLEFARRLKKQQQKQQQNQDKNKDQQNKDQKKDQNKQNQDQNKQNQDQQKQQQQQPKISRQNAEQMLKALQNDEKETQEKVKKAKAVKAESYKPEKDW